jgi:hypothetical protein
MVFLSALSLLVPRVLARDANDAAATNHLAVLASYLDGRLDLHVSLLTAG